MSKRIEIDGKFYRERRGKLVEIPAEWVGKVPTPKTIRERPSKMTGKMARVAKNAYRGDYKDRAVDVEGDLAAVELDRAKRDGEV